MKKAFNFLTRGNNLFTLNEAPRQGWVESTLKILPASLRILDAGVSEQQYRKFCSQFNYASQDFAEYDGVGGNIGLFTGKWNNSNLNIVSDITCIPEPDDSFDAILRTEVFELLPNPALAIQGFSHLLKSDSQLIIIAPSFSLTHFAPYDFATGLIRYYYEKYFEDNELKTLSLEANGNYFEYVARELRSIEDVAIHYSQKKYPSLIQRISILLVLGTLKKMFQSDSDFSEFLHFGSPVRAVKI
jgi:SAM-dependent methyltransferase